MALGSLLRGTHCRSHPWPCSNRQAIKGVAGTGSQMYITANAPINPTTTARNFAQFRAALDPSMTDATVPGAESDPQLARLWAATFATWQQTLSALGAAVPVLEGVTTRAGWPHYLQVQDDYLGMLQEAAREALDIMQQRLEERQAAGETVSGLRDLYNLWVACNEETYGRMLRGEHYARHIGHLLNALLACCPRPGEAS
jgi:hypothetical protein